MPISWWLLIEVMMIAVEGEITINLWSAPIFRVVNGRMSSLPAMMKVLVVVMIVVLVVDSVHWWLDSMLISIVSGFRLMRLIVVRVAVGEWGWGGCVAARCWVCVCWISGCVVSGCWWDCYAHWWISWFVPICWEGWDGLAVAIVHEIRMLLSRYRCFSWDHGCVHSCIIVTVVVVWVNVRVRP